MKRDTTVLAGAITIWTAVTYSFILYHSSSLAQGLALPLRSIERSLQILIKNSWASDLAYPLDSSDNTCPRIARLTNEPAPTVNSSGPPSDTSNGASSTRNPVNGSTDTSNGESSTRNPVNGSTDTENPPSAQNSSNGAEKFGLGHQELYQSSVSSSEEVNYQTNRSSRQVWFHAASSALKNIIIAAIWEFWTFHMVVAIVFLTAIYNGFLYDQRGPDAVLRLTLVCIYALLNIAHMISFWIYFAQVLDAVGNQACWVAISKAFVFFAPDNHRDSLQEIDFSEYNNKQAESDEVQREEFILYNFCWSVEKPLYLRKLDCELLGTIKTKELYRSFNEIAAEWPAAQQLRDGARTPRGHADWKILRCNPRVFEEDSETVEKTAEELLKSMIDAEVKALEKAADSGLEKILANVIVLLGLCLSTGLAPWTTIRSQESIATQIGSYAIILAVSAGATSLIASLTNMSSAAHSAKLLRRYQHYIMSLSKEQYETGFSARDARYGFPDSADPNITYMIQFCDLFSSTTGLSWKLLWIVWGPALGLFVSTRHDFLLACFWQPLRRILFRVLHGYDALPQRYRDSTVSQTAVRFRMGGLYLATMDSSATPADASSVPPTTSSAPIEDITAGSLASSAAVGNATAGSPSVPPTSSSALIGNVLSAAGPSAPRNSSSAPIENVLPATAATAVGNLPAHSPPQSITPPIIGRAAAADGRRGTTQVRLDYQYARFQLVVATGDLRRINPELNNPGKALKKEKQVPGRAAAARRQVAATESIELGTYPRPGEEVNMSTAGPSQ
ncbi:hypothetical protein NQ176_g5905 [Zarea fungicola]|uniref:Uncharacterized protein n=1 Tax=Zarea fungicola TaxID=93591 RepID=A0ACC1N7F3_9HYPO|nr:hypothetical protein NQ176_g5905 [Lecanicillium fungicola]